MKNIRLGYAMCGSFCTLSDSIKELELLSEQVDITPIMSYITANTDTRFGKAQEFIKKIEKATDKNIITTVAEAEPIGPKQLLDALVIAPCTGNTIAKLALGVTDTSVTMAAKAHLRNNRPLIIAVATNDALSANSKNIGILMNTKNVYFVPMKQDDPTSKPTSLISDFTLISQTIEYALSGKQIQPVFL